MEEEFEEKADKEDDDLESPPGAPRPLDQAFFKEWQKSRNGLLLYAIWASGSKARGAELVDQCLDKILNEQRPWREGWTLKRHCRWVIRGIQSDDFKNLSALSLRRFADDPDPDPASPETTPEEEAADNEETAVVVQVAQQVFDEAPKGSLMKRILVEATKGVRDVPTLMKNLGLTERQVVEARRGVKRKMMAALEKRGFKMHDEDEEGDDE